MFDFVTPGREQQDNLFSRSNRVIYMNINISKISDIMTNFFLCFLLLYFVKSGLGFNIFKEYHLEDMPGLTINKILE